MAATPREGLGAESKPASRQRPGRERQAFDSSRRRNWSRITQTERRGGQSGQRSPQWHARRSAGQQRPSLMMAPSSSTLTSNAPVEHFRSFAMERTPSGNSIISDNTFEPCHNYTLICSDAEAACRVKSHFSRLPSDGIHERFLRHLIESPGPLDKDALDNIITTTDSVFFDGALSGRVRWEWSHPSQQRYKTDLIGTTALRPATQGGFETLIVLSDPILRSPDYSRRLLLSAFLHELIHCYLFILCGFTARVKGGHTDGFHTIAGIIDQWVGEGDLRLCNMKANLNHFRKHRTVRIVDPRMDSLDRHSHEGCNHSPRPHMDHLEDATVIRPDWDEGYV